ncbi:hypothetical protein BKM31_48155 [[Actinomadura] parvosata subsp. kistnae]|uniref:non-specific serine/threonine protein kinase n=2 Tax=Nonomuraea TaxID=83681 RepID=A0A1V0ADE7_9ACTN|nr:hypothetical protein BKM31_48155 [Nonomuraea sp. ATCC 55076]
MSLLPEDPAEVGPYRLEGRLGAGGQGVVYTGRGPGGALVAVKLLHSHLMADDDARTRFLREVRTAERVAPFCTAQLLDSGFVGARPYIVSEYVDGPSLQDSVKESGPRGAAALQRLAINTATALAAIHAAGVVHRDFKPGNVLLGPDGPVVIDFGIAKALDLSQSVASSQPIGSPAYMAPEQIADDDVGPAADLFAWAATMYYAATGRRAFPGESIPATLHSVLHSSPDLSGVEGPLRRLLEKCLSKDQSLRPTAAEVADHLRTQLAADGRPHVDVTPAGHTPAGHPQGEVTPAGHAPDGRPHGAATPAGHTAEERPHGNVTPVQHVTAGGHAPGWRPHGDGTPAEHTAEERPQGSATPVQHATPGGQAPGWRPQGDTAPAPYAPDGPVHGGHVGDGRQRGGGVAGGYASEVSVPAREAGGSGDRRRRVLAVVSASAAMVVAVGVGIGVYALAPATAQRQAQRASVSPGAGVPESGTGGTGTVGTEVPSVSASASSPAPTAYKLLATADPAKTGEGAPASPTRTPRRSASPTRDTDATPGSSPTSSVKKPKATPEATRRSPTSKATGSERPSPKPSLQPSTGSVTWNDAGEYCKAQGQSVSFGAGWSGMKCSGGGAELSVSELCAWKYPAYSNAVGVAPENPFVPTATCNLA